MATNDDAHGGGDGGPAAGPARPPRVLVAAAPRTTRHAVRGRLEGDGYEVVEAASGRDALALARSQPFDLVIFDRALPDMSGDQLAARIRDVAGPGVGLIALGGAGRDPGDSVFDAVVSTPAEQVARAAATVLSRCRAGTRGRPLALLPAGAGGTDRALASALRRQGFDALVDDGALAGDIAGPLPDVVVIPTIGGPLGGHRLAWDVRNHPVLGRTPVVLVSPFAVDAPDQAGATRLGASAMVSFAGFADVLAAVVGRPPPDPDARALPEAECLAYLERHSPHSSPTALDDAHSAAARHARLAVLDWLAEEVCRQEEPLGPIAEVLHRLLPVLGSAAGSVHLAGDGGILAQVASAGLDAQREAAHAALAARAATAGRAVVVDALDPDPEMLASARARSVVAVPLRAGTGSVGAVVVASEGHELRAWTPFLETTSSHLGLALRLTRATRELASAEHLLHHRTRHDPVTGLPNHVLLAERLGAAVAEADAAGRGGALVLVGLDRFRSVAHAVGRHGGDVVLAQVAERLRCEVGPSVVLARTAPDEFAVLAEAAAGTDDALGLARSLLAAAARPITLDQESIRLTGSAGVVLYPDHGRDLDTMVVRGQVAMDAARGEGGGRAHVYAPGLDGDHPARLAVEQGLRSALLGQADGLRLHYQPIVGLPDREPLAAEALLRWWHPRLGEVSPARVVPVAGEAGLLPALGEWVLREACDDAGAWRAPAPGMRVSVNVDAQQLASGDLPATVAAVLAGSGLPAEALVLEVTETAALADVATSAAALGRIRDLGVGVALDDFGTGYSSLAYLRRLPVDTLKIDRSFVRELGADRGGVDIVAGVIDLAHRLDLRVVAEGVESESQLDLLVAQGCDAAQGFLFSPPVPVGALLGGNRDH